MVHKHRSMGMWRSCSSREIFRWQRETYNNNNIYFLKISCPYFSTAYYLWILNFNIRSYFFLARPYIFVVKGCWLELEIIYSQLTFFILNFWFSLLCAVQNDTREQQLRFVQSSPLNSYSSNEVQSFVFIMFIIVCAKNRTYISWLSLMTQIFVRPLRIWWWCLSEEVGRIKILFLIVSGLIPSKQSLMLSQCPLYQLRHYWMEFLEVDFWTMPLICTFDVSDISPSLKMQYFKAVPNLSGHKNSSQLWMMLQEIWIYSHSNKVTIDTFETCLLFFP